MPNIQPALEAADDATIRQLRKDPRLYLQNAWTHPNARRNYDFRTTDGDEQISYLLHDDGPLNPSNWASINILLFARGLLKTTTMIAIINWSLQFYGPMGFESYMTAPRESQVHEFVDKLRERIEDSGLNHYRTQHGDSYGHQKFKFERADGSAQYAHFKTDTGWGSGDALRGPHSHLGIADEFQDMSEEAFNAGFKPVIDQSLAGVPYFPAIFILGTPKMEGSFYEKLWERSDQLEWRPNSKEWEQTSDPQVYGEGDEALTVRAWHIDQHRAPLHSDAHIAQARDLKSPQKFANEHMAEFYSPESHLLSERHLDDIADDSMPMVDRPRFSDSENVYTTIGLDWGGGGDDAAATTVITVMEHIDHDDESSPEHVISTIDILDKGLSKREEFETLEDYIQAFDANRILVDEGYGSSRREDLQQGNGTRESDGYDNLYGVRFGNISGKFKWVDSETKRLFTVNRSHYARRFVDAIHSRRVTLPTANISTGAYGSDNALGTRIYRQLTAPYEERKSTSSSRKTQIKTESGQRDDVFFASLYSWLGYSLDALGPSTSRIEFRTTTAPGI